MKRRSTRTRSRTLAVLALALSFFANAQLLTDNSPELLKAAARVPVSFDVGGENLFARRVGVRVGASVYPLPLLLNRELNADGFADVTYTLRGGVNTFLASANAALYAGAGPRYRLINSALFLNGTAPGAYVGAGGMAGADFRLGAVGFSLVSAFAEAGADYLWPLGESAGTGALSPRVRVGLSIPLAGF